MPDGERAGERERGNRGIICRGLQSTLFIPLVPLCSCSIYDQGLYLVMVSRSHTGQYRSLSGIPTCILTIIRFIVS